jgi:glycerol uptake facilitator-like aquaporin
MKNVLIYIIWFKTFIEILGTFIFVSTIITQKNPIIIGFVFTIIIIISSYIGIRDPGVHFNPIISMIILLEDQFHWKDAIRFISSQLIGGLLAWKMWSNYNIIKKF